MGVSTTTQTPSRYIAAVHKVLATNKPRLNKLIEIRSFHESLVDSDQAHYIRELVSMHMPLSDYTLLPKQSITDLYQEVVASATDIQYRRRYVVRAYTGEPIEAL